MSNQTQDISAYVEKSKNTDVVMLLKAKELARKNVLDDPSTSNLAAFERASRMLDQALDSEDKNKHINFKNVDEVCAHLQEIGRKTSKRQIFRDIKAGKLQREKDGIFSFSAVEKYGCTRPLVSMPEKAAEEIADLAEEKLREEMLCIRAVRMREEFDLAVKRGEYLPKDDVFQELAARAFVLSFGLKAAFEARIAELIEIVHGDMKAAPAGVGKLHEILDMAFNEYSKDMEFTVSLPDAEC